MYRLKFVRMYSNSVVLYQANAKAPAIPFAVTIKAESTLETEYPAELNADLIASLLAFELLPNFSDAQSPVELEPPVVLAVLEPARIVVGRSELDVTPSPLCTDTAEVYAWLDLVTCTTVMSQSYSTSPVTTSMKPSRYLRS